MTTIYNVKFILSHAVVITAVPVDDENTMTLYSDASEEEIVRAAKTFLEWDGIDVSRADAIEVEKV